jgi:pimeloyl-[acyl-carrier protein] methyl ester esterase
MSASKVPGERCPLVFLHGWSADGSFFAAQALLAEQGFRLLMPDLPGHGVGARPDASLTLARMADSLATLIDTLEGPEKPVLVGWSMGAFVCLDYLARYGAARVAGLAMIDMTAKVANDDGWRLGLASGQRAEDMVAQSGEMATQWPAFSARVSRAIFARGSTPEAAIVARTEAAMARNDGPTMAALWRDLARADFRADLAALDIPLLVVLGGLSRIYRPALAEWYRRTVPKAEVRVLEASGHAPQIEEPEAFNALLAAFASACCPGSGRP